MCTRLPILVPSDQFFRCETDGDHQELQVKPVGPEPKEQVDAEDHRQRAEAQRVGVASRPGEQDVEGVCEKQLRDDQIIGVVNLPPVPAPVEENRGVHASLKIVLRAEAHFEGEGAMNAPRRGEQDRVPHQQRGRGTDERPPEAPILPHRFEKDECSEAHREGEGQRKGLGAR